MGHFDGRLGPSEGMVLEAKFTHLRGLQHVAAVQNERAHHQMAYTLPIEIAKFRPIGKD